MDDHDLGALWNAALRSMRAQRPSLASKGARARTFGAGLEQAEQLWAASDRVGPIASPLLLFYGLTQAGRAICAAGVRTPSWEGAQNHGLKFKLSRPTEESLLSLKEVRVAANGNGLIHDVAQVLASPVLASEVCFSDLLSALDCPLFFEDDQFTEHRPLEVQEDGMLMATHRDPVRKSLYIGPLPEALACRREQVPAGARNLAYTRALPPSAEEVDEWLASYPRLHRLGTPTDIGDPEPADHVLQRGDWAIRLKWEGNAVKGLTQSQWTVQQLDVLLSDLASNARGLVLPALGGNAEPQHRLITWWLTLYSLSMLARYYPREWTAILDVDRSPLAVPLEHLISSARSKIVELVARALKEL